MLKYRHICSCFSMNYYHFLGAVVPTLHIPAVLKWELPLTTSAKASYAKLRAIILNSVMLEEVSSCYSIAHARTTDILLCDFHTV